MFMCEDSADSRLQCVILWSAVCLITMWIIMEGHFREYDHLYTGVPLVMLDVGDVVDACVCRSSDQTCHASIPTMMTLMMTHDKMYENEPGYIEIRMCM